MDHPFSRVGNSSFVLEVWEASDRLSLPSSTEGWTMETRMETCAAVHLYDHTDLLIASPVSIQSRDRASRPAVPLRELGPISLCPHSYAGRATGHTAAAEANKDPVSSRIKRKIAAALREDRKGRCRVGVDLRGHT